MFATNIFISLVLFYLHHLHPTSIHLTPYGIGHRAECKQKDIYSDPYHLSKRNYLLRHLDVRFAKSFATIYYYGLRGF